MGTKYELVRRDSMISLVIPSSEKRKWRLGSSKGELSTGFSMTICFIVYPSGFNYIIRLDTLPTSRYV